MIVQIVKINGAQASHCISTSVNEIVKSGLTDFTGNFDDDRDLEGSPKVKELMESAKQKFIDRIKTFCL